MRIGIVTIDDEVNYGNRLQNYAVHNIMKDYGCIADTIVVKMKEKTFYRNENIVKKIIRDFFPPSLFFRSIQFVHFVKSELSRDVEAKRKRIFAQFTAMQIAGKYFYINRYEDIYHKNDFEQYDYLLTGSDQVWNPYFAGSDYFFLTFVPPEKRIGFIASIGVSELPEAQKARYAALLTQMKYISVREESAVQIIDELIHKKVDCFLDPVLLLERKKWESLVAPVNLSIPSKYVLSFFLGEEPKEKLEAYAVQHNLMIVHMNQKKYEEYYLLGPEQLLYMIKNAEFVMTDSFHVTAFSIIFHKQFYVFHRRDDNMKDMFSRMENLLEKLHLFERVQNEDSIKETKIISSERYVEIDTILKEERQKFNRVMEVIVMGDADNTVDIREVGK